jgi:2-succinyl-5-enolpyruvyl-6-hydroxy-3-cyclohexene-1-carboxylate synthase
MSLTAMNLTAMSPATGTPSGPLRAVTDALVEGGVRDVIICPGSRSTPLALALRTDARLRCWIQIDERAGAFFALGMAAASRRPTAILVTSGTAAVELAPAIVEARYGRQPIIAFTADRPPEARDRGAPQTIDQAHLFGRSAKWYTELPLPEDGEAAALHVRGLVARAVAVASTTPAGPVHLNAPFREPLVPAGAFDRPPGVLDVPSGAPGAPPDRPGRRPTTSMSGVRLLSEADLADLAARLAAARRGLIVCGPLDRPGFAPAVAALAAASGSPILADALSNVRFGDHDRSAVIAHTDALVRAPAFAAEHTPDVVVRFGGTPTSRALVEWIAAGAAEQVVVDDGGWSDPVGLPLTMVAADPVQLAATLAAAVPRDEAATPATWQASWRAADDRAGAVTRAWLDRLGEPFEGEVFDVLGATLPEGAVLLAGNSMPVRDMDAFIGRGAQRLRCVGNRGANGIDGLVSTALGMAAAADGPVVAVVGDIAFLHDLNALLAARRHGLAATIVVLNNDGGGIFSFLPQAAAARRGVGLPEHFEELFGTPHGVELGPLVRALGADHREVSSRDLAAAVAASIATAGLQVLEVRTERTRNVELHRELLAEVTRAVDGTPVTGAPP